MPGVVLLQVKALAYVLPSFVVKKNQTRELLLENATYVEFGNIK